MTAGMEAVFAVLTGAVEDPIPVDATIGAWTCKDCQRVLLIPDSGGTCPDEWLAMTGHTCSEGGADA